MGVEQMTTEAAVRLNELEAKIAASREALDAEQERYDALWRQVYHEFDGEIGEASAARFLAADGYVLARIMANVKPSIDAKKLIALLRERMPGNATKLISRVVVMEPVVDQSALAHEIERGALDAEVIEEAVTRKAPQPRKYRRLASKKELASLAAGIIESPTEWEEQAAG